MPWPKTGATQYHAQLGPQAKNDIFNLVNYQKAPLLVKELKIWSKRMTTSIEVKLNEMNKVAVIL